MENYFGILLLVEDDLRLIFKYAMALAEDTARKKRSFLSSYESLQVTRVRQAHPDEPY